jgi:hypothetical protein
MRQSSVHRGRVNNKGITSTAEPSMSLQQLVNRSIDATMTNLVTDAAGEFHMLYLMGGEVRLRPENFLADVTLQGCF